MSSAGRHKGFYLYNFSQPFCLPRETVWEPPDKSAPWWFRLRTRYICGTRWLPSWELHEQTASLQRLNLSERKASVAQLVITNNPSEATFLWLCSNQYCSTSSSFLHCSLKPEVDVRNVIFMFSCWIKMPTEVDFWLQPPRHSSSNYLCKYAEQFPRKPRHFLARAE